MSARFQTIFLLSSMLILILAIELVDSAKTKKSKSISDEGSKPAKKKIDESKRPKSKNSNSEKSKTEKFSKEENKTKEGNNETKVKKPWNKLTKADWDRLENEAEDREPWKPPEPPSVAFDPQNPMEYVQASKKGKPGMMFATLTKVKDEKTGKMRVRTKEETEEVSFRMKSLLQSGHVDSTPYVIDPGKILWTIQDGSKGYTVKNFLLKQPEVEEFEWDNQKTPKSAFNPEGPEAEL